MCTILEKKNLKKITQPRTKLPENAVCEVCGCNNKEIKLRRFNEYIVCIKHYNQLDKYGEITDISCRKHKQEVKNCCICNSRGDGLLANKVYCTKHLLQMKRYGKISERTIYDKNEYIFHDTYAEIVMYDKNSNITGTTKIDLDKVTELQQYKIYCKLHNTKNYATINMKDGRKIRLNRYLLGLTNLDEYTTKEVVDHINGDSMDNRLCNLRICTQKENMANVRKSNKFVGISKLGSKWVARIMHNYKTTHLGTFNTKAEAILARIKAEKEIVGNYGPNKDYYYLINHPSPVEEVQRIFSEGV